MRTVFVVLLFILLTETCLPTHQATDSPTLPRNEAALRSCAQQAKLIVVAKLVEVRPPLAFGSGQVLVVQWVHYAVEEVIKGGISDRSISVGHYVLARKSTVEEGGAQLSPKLFTKGGRFVLFLETDPKKGYIDSGDPTDKLAASYLAIDSCGLVAASEQNIALVKKAL